MNALDQLIGQKLEAADASSGEVGLQFSGASVSLYNRTDGDKPESCVGAVVAAVQYKEGEAFTIIFSNGRAVNVSLKDADYVGPEAFCVRFDCGPIVVE